MKSKYLTAVSTLLSAGSIYAAPAELDQRVFADSSIAPSPACLSAHPNGDVFVGVDMLGSLGKGAGKGKIVKLIDENNDGKVDKHVTFANIDNPRGLIAVGNKLYVLHTVIPADTGILTGMHLSVLEDKDGDNVADGPAKRLIKNISCKLHNQKRGADHTTNGIRMGIDGWIYIALGDFGFVDAEGTDGKKMTKLGGGIVRVRPDGSEMEMYTHGLRNIYDMAIDPLMNIYTRGNTNDGGGWNVRFIHQIQSADYGYPMLFKGFTDEVLPALVDLGGGSGTGSMFFQEPGWPAKYNNVPLMGDWGRSHVYIHRLTKDGASFTQKQEKYITSSQMADIDVDGSGRMFIAAWAGAGYSGNPKRGHVEIVTPKGWTYKAFPDLTKSTESQLIELIKSDSATARLHAQQQLISRKSGADAVLAVATDTTESIESRVAAIFTYAQLKGARSHAALTALAADKQVEEFALRALADRVTQNSTVSLEPFYKGLKSADSRVQAAAAIGLGRLGKIQAAQALLNVAIPPVKTEEPKAKKINTTTSALITGSKQAAIEVDISKFGKAAYLSVLDGGNGNAQDHAAWINPRVVLGDGSEVVLTKKDIKVIKKGWGKLGINKDCTGKPLKNASGNALTGFGTHAHSIIELNLASLNKPVKFKATGILTKTAGSVKFAVADGSKANTAGRQGGPHETPNSPIIVPHLAVKSLRQLKAADACLAAIDSKSQDGALWALRYMHDEAVVKGLISKLKSTTDQKLQIKLITALARLYTKEAEYDGSWWWNTRPDTRGPYYVPVKWEASPAILEAYNEFNQAADAETKETLKAIAAKHRMFEKKKVAAKDANGAKGLKIAKKKVGDLSIENVIEGLTQLKGNVTKGKAHLQLGGPLACAGCHDMFSDKQNGYPKLSNMGDVFTREGLAEAILKPAATIAENWCEVTDKAGAKFTGTITFKDDKKVVLYMLGGVKKEFNTADVTVKKQAFTLMGPHLADNLTMQQFADVVDFFHSQKAKKKAK